MKCLQHLLLLLPALMWPDVFHAEPTSYEKTFFPGVVGFALGCPAPAPDSLWATDVTPTSVSLAWTPIVSPTVIYYTVEGYDLTGGTPLPTYVVTSNSITYNGLTAGHNYKFDVSASYCPDGPPGEARQISVPIPPILIDLIIYLDNPCTPGSSQGAGAGTAYSFCVQQSTSSEPYTNGFVGSITYNNQQLLFAVAFYADTLRIGELNGNNSNFYFSPVNASSVACYSSTGTKLFTATHLNGTPVVPRLRIVFNANCSNFRSCGSACGGTAQADERSVAQPTSEILENKPYPNPFSDLALFRYELNEDAPVEINLYDAMGRLMHSVENTSLQSKGQHEAVVKGADLPDGLYFLQTKIGEHRKAFVLVKRE